jgi:hypothetical protein
MLVSGVVAMDGEQQLYEARIVPRIQRQSRQSLGGHDKIVNDQQRAMQKTPWRDLSVCRQEC